MYSLLTFAFQLLWIDFHFEHKQIYTKIKFNETRLQFTTNRFEQLVPFSIFVRPVLFFFSIFSGNCSLTRKY